ncbi:NAD-glutamate dehydrogenase [Moritella yayanosii]|uniref:NAD-specific glutamate dehydrogenase n=2 Tax=Alteromonadales TaxID=135622 RepID=A0A330LLD3_9GAMM|nr:NAD-glutamate dehydrogenase [Moritella yayanosii]SQD77212.1 NAD-specific glutamate dehydrogenase [Moritella yayanosii]
MLNKTPIPVLLENVISLVKTKVDAKSNTLVEQFVTALYAGMRQEDLSSRSDSDLYCAAISLWNRLNSSNNSGPDICVYNPEISLNGWQSTHTIVEIIVPDSPFLTESVMMALSRLGVISHLMLHQPIALKRDDNGRVNKILTNLKNAKNYTTETVFLIEIDRQTESRKLDAISAELNSVLNEVALAVGDWSPMQDKLTSVIEMLSSRPKQKGIDYSDTIKFLKWLGDHNFTLLGYRHYDIEPVKGDYVITPDCDSSLGIMKNSVNNKGYGLSNLSTDARREVLSQNTLLLTKSDAKSRVHRPANIDYVGIKLFDENNKVIGEERFIGLYASSIYNSSAIDIPLISDKIKRVLIASGYNAATHSYKALLNILETYPRDEIIQSSEADILHCALGVLNMQDRDQVKLFVRKDLFGRYYSCMVYVTKERYNTLLREKTQQVLADYLGSDKEVEFNTYFSEGNMARTHYLVHVDQNDKEMKVNISDIEQNITEAAKSWNDKFKTAIVSHYGEEKGRYLSERYGHAFPQSYKEHVLPNSAVADVIKLEKLSADHKLEMIFYRAQEEQYDSNHVRLKLFHKDHPIHLSDVLPMLENMGLKVLGETPFKVKTADGTEYWVLDFTMLYTGENVLDTTKRSADFMSTFHQVWEKRLENDGFNKLVLKTNLAGRQISVLRAYAKYMRQIGNNFSQTYIENTLTSLPELANSLYCYFHQKFAMDQGEIDSLDIIANFETKLEDVHNLDDDRIIRRFIDLITATSRTNFYQIDPSLKTADQSKAYISFKFESSLIPDMPLPLPKFEVFVYSPQVEGVHLRGGKVARGGLRWSDRREDFRTEVLGLVKAQQVKNTVIVPVGAKGGFVCKEIQPSHTRDEIFNIGKQCYRTFIRGLLDITDNIVDGELVHPQNVRFYDEDDSYLVVAADKGTATFSDIANEISAEYNFWLGDAFASGGSVGYDHKKMGITAKGAWESVKRHFREMGINCQEEEFTCIAIGDMAGDVFGNGMLLSKSTKLIAAFNHMHIFIDPTPDCATSFEERKRLFNLPRSSWSDYDRSIMSKGSGIFLRSAKAITLTSEIKKMLGTNVSLMTPTDLIKAILTSQADLLWNGGIGTYVKAITETNNDVGDRANDHVRINGNELNVKIVGEGGNLGCTQLGRIEYAKNGGRINSDFIDNVGGVDCSDNEVNIKILLNSIVSNGDLTRKQRNELLYSMTDEVSKIVLNNAYKQTLSVSVTQTRAPEQLKEQIRFMQLLERSGKLNRQLEFLPNEDELAERLAKNEGLTRPELSVLLAYAKMQLKEQLNCPEVYEDEFLSKLLITAFPELLQDRYKDQMQLHPLKNEIIATQLANEIINDMGLNFVGRMQDETGSTVVEIAKCFIISKNVIGMANMWDVVTGLDNKLDSETQLDMLFESRRYIRRATCWLVRYRDRNMSIADTIAFYKPIYDGMKENTAQVLVDADKEKQKKRIDDLVEKSVPSDIANEIIHQNTLFSTFDIADVCKQHQVPMSLVQHIFFALGNKLQLHDFMHQINLQPVANHWQALARSAFREELALQQRSLTSVVLSTCSSTGKCDIIIGEWLADHDALVIRWLQMLADFNMSSSHEFAKFSVVLRELNLLHLSCRNAS